jgi:hypothetical protein
MPDFSSKNHIQRLLLKRAPKTYYWNNICAYRGDPKA